MKTPKEQPKFRTVYEEMIATRFSTGEFDNALTDVPNWIMDCPVYANWTEYKGETYFGILNFDRSLKARRPMIDLSLCATRAMNGVVIKTVQYSEKHFKKSRLEV